MSTSCLRVVVRVSFWTGGLLGLGSGALGVVNLALASGICGAFGTAAGMICAIVTNRVATLELEKLQVEMRGEAIAHAVSL